MNSQRPKITVEDITTCAFDIAASSDEACSQVGPKRLAETIGATLAEQVADRLFSAFTFTKKFNITVISPDHYGYGDLLFGLRICHLLQETFPHINVTMVTTSTGKKSVELLKGDKEFDVNVMDINEFKHALSEAIIPSPDLIIEGPVYSILDNNFCIYQGQPLLILSEYGADNTKAITTRSATERKSEILTSHTIDGGIEAINTGFKPDEEGVLIDERLTQTIDRAEQWKKIPSSLRDILFQGQSAAEYDQHHDVARSYTSDYFERGIAIYGEFEKESDKNADLILLGKNSNRCLNLSQETLQSLRNNGFTTLAYHNFENDKTLYVDLTTGSQSEEVKAYPGRIFRIIYGRAIPHEALMVLNSLSCSFCISTGDQSQTEAFSSPNITTIAYESLVHKRPFIAGVRALAKQYRHEAPGVERAIQLLTWGATKKEEKIPFDAALLTELGSLIRNPQIQKALQLMNNKIRTDYNIGERITARVNRLLMMEQYPHLRNSFKDYFWTIVGIRFENYGLDEIKKATQIFYQSLIEREVIMDSMLPNKDCPLMYRSVSDAILHNDYLQMVLELNQLKSEGGIEAINEVYPIAVYEEENEQDESCLRLPINAAVAAEDSNRMVRKLIQYGANVNQCDDKGRVALHVAAQHGKCDMIDLLIEQHADINQIDNGGATPLHYAIEYGQVAAASHLIKMKAMVNTRLLDNGETPLHTAVINGRVDMFLLLLKNGADLMAENSDHLTPIACAQDESIKAVLNNAALKQGQQERLQYSHYKYYSKLGMKSAAPHFFEYRLIKPLSVESNGKISVRDLKKSAT